MKESSVNSLLLAKDCVNREISEARVYHALLFKWNNGLHNEEGFERELGGLFHYVRDALETKYILSLAKLFAPSDEAGLWCLMQLTKAISKKWLDLKRERYPDFKERSKQERKKFLSNYKRYEAKIRKINKKINPYRNIQRAHNYPWRVHQGKETWDETKKWLTFAETVFVRAMDGICEGCCRVGDFYPSGLDSEIEYFISLMGKGLADAKRKKEELRRAASGMAEEVRSSPNSSR